MGKYYEQIGKFSLPLTGVIYPPKGAQDAAFCFQDETIFWEKTPQPPYHFWFQKGWHVCHWWWSKQKHTMYLQRRNQKAKGIKGQGQGSNAVII